MIDFDWKNEANRWRSEICLIRSYADSLLKAQERAFEEEGLIFNLRLKRRSFTK